MELAGFKDFTRLNESQLEYYSIEFDSQEIFTQDINSRFEKKLKEILGERISPFLHETKINGDRDIDIMIRISPNDFLSDIVSQDQISIKVLMPTSSMNNAKKRVNPSSIFDTFSSLKYYESKSVPKTFIDSKINSYVTKISFSVDPTLLTKATQDAALLLGRTNSDIKRPQLTDFSSAQVYELFMTVGENKEKVREFADLVESIARYETLLDFFEDSIEPLAKTEIPNDVVDSAIEIARSVSPEKEEVASMQKVLKSLMINSQSGRPNSTQNAYLLSKLMGALIENHDSTNGIKRLLASVK